MPGVLVIDNEDKTHLMIEQSFKIRRENTGEEWKSTLVVDASKVAELAPKTEFDLLIVDQTMVNQPPKKWLETFFKLINRQVPALACGFEANLPKILAWLDAGFVDYIVKPADRPLLIEKIILAATGKRDASKQVYSLQMTAPADIARQGIIEELSEFDVQIKSRSSFQLGDLVTFYAAAFAEEKAPFGAVLGRCYVTGKHPADKELNQSRFVYVGVQPNTLKNIRTNLRKEYVAKKGG
mgnify:CR=1 FL=1